MTHFWRVGCGGQRRNISNIRYRYIGKMRPKAVGWTSSKTHHGQNKAEISKIDCWWGHWDPVEIPRETKDSQDIKQRTKAQGEAPSSILSTNDGAAAGLALPKAHISVPNSAAGLSPRCQHWAREQRQDQNENFQHANKKGSHLWFSVTIFGFKEKNGVCGLVSREKLDSQQFLLNVIPLPLKSQFHSLQGIQG